MAHVLDEPPSVHELRPDLQHRPRGASGWPLRGWSHWDSWCGPGGGGRPPTLGDRANRSGYSSRCRCSRLHGAREAVPGLPGSAVRRRNSCSTYTGAEIYGNVSSSHDLQPLDDTGYMEPAPAFGSSPAASRINPPLGGNTNDWWLHTRGDGLSRSSGYGYTHAWGYLPATAVTREKQTSQSPASRSAQNIPKRLCTDPLHALQCWPATFLICSFHDGGVFVP